MQAAEVAVWALIGALTWTQLRRWQRPTGAAEAAADVDAASSVEQELPQEGNVSKAGPAAVAIAADASPAGGSLQQQHPAEAEAAAIDALAHSIVDQADEEAHRKVRFVGSAVNLPDMSANLKAKVTVSEAQQSDPRLLASVYDDMAEKFQQHGLNLPAVEAMRQYFTIEGAGEAEPLEYDAFPVPLPPGAVRLGVIFFQEVNPQLAEMVHQAAQEVVAALPEGAQFHINKPSHYHVTVFMSSQPHTLRPDPFDPANGGLPLDGTPAEQAAASKPDPATLEREVSAYRSAAASTSAPRFEVHRLVMADSGTLLLCSVDHSGHLAALRRRLRAAFPGGPPKQSTIVHASIARLLTPEQLTTEQITRVQAVCDAWSERLRGQRFNPERIYHIQEHTFTTVEGPRIGLPFQGST